jgi:ATP-binding protein involved in chromosome partitioning
MGGGEKIAKDMGIPFLGRIPIEPKICEDSDSGIPFVINHSDSASAEAFAEIVKKIEGFIKIEAVQADSPGKKGD